VCGLSRERLEKNPMNLAPLFTTMGLSLGLSCVIFVLRERLHAGSRARPLRPAPIRNVRPAVFSVSRLPSIYR